MLVSYIDKKKWGKKNVIVITTMYDNVKVANDRQKKPHVHVMYDHTKGGVDIVDLLSTNHSTRIKSKRWPLNAYAFVLDSRRTNAKTIPRRQQQHHSYQFWVYVWAWKMLLSSQEFNDDLKIQAAFRSKSSTKWHVFLISKK